MVATVTDTEPTHTNGRKIAFVICGDDWGGFTTVFAVTFQSDLANKKIEQLTAADTGKRYRGIYALSIEFLV